MRNQVPKQIARKATSRERNFLFTLNNPKQSPEELLRVFKESGMVRFVAFQFEIGEKGGVPHFQGYLELEQPKSLRKINSLLLNNLAHIEPRRGSQEEALAYCTDKTKSLVRPETFTFGEKRCSYSAINLGNKEIPQSREEQGVHIEDKIVRHEYTSLAEVHADYPYLVIMHRDRIQKMLLENNPIDIYRVSPANVGWLYGPSGVGKSCYTEQLLRSKGYLGTEITYQKSDLQTALGFDVTDEQRKVLVVEEVRPQGPRYNSLIGGVDKKTFLPCKGSLIRNNFELIVINSLWSPYDCYSEANLPANNIIEPLRRVYSGMVLQLSRNEENLASLKERLRNGEISPIEFKFLLEPRVTDVTCNIPKCLRGEEPKKSVRS